MAVTFVTHEGSVTDLQLVGAQSGKRIVVLRVACHTPAAGTLILNTRAGAARGAALCGALTVVTSRLNDIDFGRAYALATNVGEALSADLTIGASTDDVALTIWYEVVP